MILRLTSSLLGISVTLALLGGCSPSTDPAPAWSHGQTWLTDLSQAQSQAKADNRLVFVNFTGSDWCPGCQRLRRDVLNTSEFAAFAKESLVLVEVDFPKRKPQADTERKANEALAVKHQIEAFPTVLVFDAAGRELSRRVGYRGEGAQEYVAGLRSLKKS
jgi:thioredoxin-related protein